MAFLISLPYIIALGVMYYFDAPLGVMIFAFLFFSFNVFVLYNAYIEKKETGRNSGPNVAYWEIFNNNF